MEETQRIVYFLIFATIAASHFLIGYNIKKEDCPAFVTFLAIVFFVFDLVATMAFLGDFASLLVKTF